MSLLSVNFFKRFPDRTCFLHVCCYSLALDLSQYYLKRYTVAEFELFNWGGASAVNCPSSWQKSRIKFKFPSKIKDKLPSHVEIGDGGSCPQLLRNFRHWCYIHLIAEANLTLYIIAFKVKFRIISKLIQIWLFPIWRISPFHTWFYEFPNVKVLSSWISIIDYVNSRHSSTPSHNADGPWQVSSLIVTPQRADRIWDLPSPFFYYIRIHNCWNTYLQFASEMFSINLNRDI